MAKMSHIRAIMAPETTDSQSFRVKSVNVMTLTNAKFMIDVESAGFSLPKMVGSIDGKNANWQTAITISCQLILQIYFDTHWAVVGA